MVFKKLIFLFAFLIFFNNYVFAIQEGSENDSLRRMFQNNKAVIYSLNIRTFNADDKDGNGIIQFSRGETSGSFINAIERLDELKSLGINTVHLLPVTPVGKIKALGTAGSLYSLSDFTGRGFDVNVSLSFKEIAIILYPLLLISLLLL